MYSILSFPLYKHTQIMLWHQYSLSWLSNIPSDSMEIKKYEKLINMK